MCKTCCSFWSRYFTCLSDLVTVPCTFILMAPSFSAFSAACRAQQPPSCFNVVFECINEMTSNWVIVGFSPRKLLVTKKGFVYICCPNTQRVTQYYFIVVYIFKLKKVQWCAGRVCGAASHPVVPQLEGRGSPQRLPDPSVSPRHQPGVSADGWPRAGAHRSQQERWCGLRPPANGSQYNTKIRML